MKRNVMLIAMSLLSILLLSIHVTDDIIRGKSGGGLENLLGILILVVLLCGTLLLAERRSGLIIMLLGGIFAAGMPVLHMRGPGVGGEFAKTPGAFLFIWTLYALGVTGTFAFILAVRELLMQRAQPR